MNSGKEKVLNTIAQLFSHPDFLSLPQASKEEKLNTVLNSNLVKQADLSRDEVINVFQKHTGHHFLEFPGYVTETFPPGLPLGAFRGQGDIGRYIYRTVNDPLFNQMGDDHIKFLLVKIVQKFPGPGSPTQKRNSVNAAVEAAWYPTLPRRKDSRQFPQLGDRNHLFYGVM